MVSEIEKEASRASLDVAEVWIPDFGALDTAYIEPDKQYQGRLYRLSADNVKSLSELAGFTAKFDSASIRDCILDIIKTEGHIQLEIDRNTSPTELALRYSRDRWSTIETPTKPGAALRPWIKTVYETRFLPERTLQGICDIVKVKQDLQEHFFIRINLKDRLAGLIVEEKYVEELPAGAFQAFALPQGQTPIVPIVELAEAVPAGPVREAASVQAPADGGARYATYSKSEIDRMLSKNAEGITSALSAKISSQQRIFQDAVAAQEKAFARLVDKISAQVEETRTKLESHTKTAGESARSDLDQFKKELSKELEQFRQHINKNVLPLSKVIEEKVKSLSEANKSGGVEMLKPLVLGAAAVILLAVLASTGFLYMNLSKHDATGSQSATVQQNK